MNKLADTPLVLGIDVGTTGTKCTFYDLNGRPAASEYQEYAMIHPREGWVEEDPDSWWAAVARNVGLCIRRDGIDPARVAGIGVSCTNSFIPLDADGNALHNAILQLDQRAAAEVEWLREHIGGERIFAVTGNRIARGTFALPTLLWFLNHRPDIIARTHKFVVPSGFIIRKLTGNFSINTSRMSFTLLADIRTGAWDAALARDVGVPMDLLPQPYRADEIVGEVTRQAAELTGLRPGTPVIAGAMDTVAAAVGGGRHRAGRRLSRHRHLRPQLLLHRPAGLRRPSDELPPRRRGPVASTSRRPTPRAPRCAGSAMSSGVPCPPPRAAATPTPPWTPWRKPRPPEPTA